MNVLRCMISPSLMIVGICLIASFAAAYADSPKNPGQHASTSKEVQPGDVRSDNGLQMPLIWCPPGSYTNEWYGGAPLNFGSDAFHKEQVTLTIGYWIGQYEVTQDEWKKVMMASTWADRNARSQEKITVQVGPRLPAHYMTWGEAVEFCKRLTDSERAADRLGANEEYRLPTEAEWNHSCMAGKAQGIYFCGNDETELQKYAWFDGPAGEGESGMHEVGQKQPNRWNIFDMQGNVSELCLDGHQKWPAFGKDPVNRIGRVEFRRTFQAHVKKGGPYFSKAVGCETFNRGYTFGLDGGASHFHGFRVVRGTPIDMTPPEAK